MGLCGCAQQRLIHRELEQELEQELSKRRRVLVKSGRNPLSLWLPYHSKYCTLGSKTWHIFFTGWMSFLCLEIAGVFMGCFLQKAEKQGVLDYTFLN